MGESMCIHASERDAALRGERARETGEAGAEAFKTSGAAGARLSLVLSLSLSASSVSVSLWPKARLALSLVFVPSLSLSLSRPCSARSLSLTTTSSPARSVRARSLFLPLFVTRSHVRIRLLLSVRSTRGLTTETHT